MFLDLRDLTERSNKISMLCVNDQNLNWGYLFSLVLFHSLNGFVGASSLYALLSSISNAHNLTWRTCLVCETLEPDKKDSAKPPLAISEFVIAATQPLQSNQSPNALKYVISMWSPSNIIKNLWVPYCSCYCHWIHLAMTYIGWPSTATISWPLFKWSTAFQIIPIWLFDHCSWFGVFRVFTKHRHHSSGIRVSCWWPSLVGTESRQKINQVGGH